MLARKEALPQLAQNDSWYDQEQQDILISHVQFDYKIKELHYISDPIICLHIEKTPGRFRKEPIWHP